MSKDDKIKEIAQQVAFIIAQKLAKGYIEEITKMSDEDIDEMYDTRPFDNDNKNNDEEIEKTQNSIGEIIKDLEKLIEENNDDIPECIKQRRRTNLN